MRLVVEMKVWLQRSTDHVPNLDLCLLLSDEESPAAVSVSSRHALLRLWSSYGGYCCGRMFPRLLCSAKSAMRILNFPQAIVVSKLLGAMSGTGTLQHLYER